MQDLLVDPNLAARGFWILIEHPELQTAILYPKQFLRSSENEVAMKSRAPLIGEHNAEIYAELGMSSEQISALRRAGVI